MKLVSLDIETTGVNVLVDRIIQAAFIVYEVDELNQFKEIYRRCDLINPTVSVGDSFDIHGISDEVLADKQPFRYYAQKYAEIIEKCDGIIGYKSNKFDIPMLSVELERCGIEVKFIDKLLIDVGEIYARLNERTLKKAVKVYLDKEHEDAHDAAADADATAQVFMKMMERHKEEFEDIKAAAFYSNYDSIIIDVHNKFVMKNNEVVLNFGKDAGKVAKTQVGFLQWMARDTTQLPSSSKAIANQILNDLRNVE